MAATTAYAATVITTFPTQNNTKRVPKPGPRLLLWASVGSVRRRKERFPAIDTRIHWDNQEEGWIGGKTQADDAEKQEDVGEMLSNLLKKATNSHYELLGVSAEASLEEIKLAYRRLSKECHPETTALPIRVAHDRFAHLRKAFDILSNEASRRSYDQRLVLEVIKRRQANAMKPTRLEDPYEHDVRNWKSTPDMVDRLGGKNMKLSYQTLMTALSIDFLAVLVSISCIIYAFLFKEPN